MAGLWPALVSSENLYLAYLKARRGKQHRVSVAQFSLNLEGELLTLQRELVNGCYQPGPFREFHIRERKPRLIAAAPFRDRVVHHGLMNVLEPVFERRFYHHSYACRPGKGGHRAVNQYQCWAGRYPWVLKLDIARYFASVRHDVLLTQLQRTLKDQPLLALLEQIIRHAPASYPPGRGLPIGNLTSQYLANFYLNGLDHWIKQQGIPVYLRYVDDLILLGHSTRQLLTLREALPAQLAPLGLALHPAKQEIMRSSERVDVLGYRVSPHRRWLRNDNGHRFARRLRAMAEQFAVHQADWSDIRPRLASWIGHAQHGETVGLRRAMMGQVVFQRRAMTAPVKMRPNPLILPITQKREPP